MFFLLSKNAQLFERRRGSNGKSNQFLSRERTSTLQVHFCAFNNEIESIKMNRRFKRHLSCSRYRMSALFFSPSTRHKTVCFVILFISSLKEKNKKISIYECVFACVYALHISPKREEMEQYDLFALFCCAFVVAHGQLQWGSYCCV